MGSIIVTTGLRSDKPTTREVWCYSQWQPAFMQMLVTIPQIEFVKDILSAVEQEPYFYVNKRNLIVFDDQMIDAGKDKRIVKPFTRGFHHRSLCAIYIVQNFIRGKVAEALVSTVTTWSFLRILETNCKS